MKLLKEKLSENLELAIQAFKEVIEDSRYEIDHNEWHYPKGRVKVGLVGSLIAKVFKGDITKELTPNDFTEDKAMLYALNLINVGEISNALLRIGQFKKIKNVSVNLTDNELFILDMKIIKNNLEKLGY